MSLDLALAQRELLRHDLGLTEIRTVEDGKQWFCKSPEEFKATLEKNKLLERNCYIGVNPRRIESGVMDAVSHMTSVVLDIDPVREKDTASTPEQHTAAINLAKKISEDLSGYVVSSGSGAHVYLPIEPIEVKNHKALTESVKDWFTLVKKKYATNDLKIDAIYDLPRIIRLWGSYNQRSNRPCCPLPEQRLPSRKGWKFSQELRVKEVVASDKRLESKDSPAVSRFNKMCLINPSLGKIMRQDARFESKSEADFAFVSILVKAHFTPEEIKELIVLNPMGRRDPDARGGDVDRIIEKVINNGLETVSLVNNSGRYTQSLSTRGVGIPTGFKTLDDMISGLKAQKVYLFAARPTEGKTTIITQILSNVAEKGYNCVYFPTEVGAEPIYDKIVSRRTKISLRKFQNGDFDEKDRKTIEAVMPSVKQLPLAIVEDFSLTDEKIEQVIIDTCPDVVAIDYIQAMRYDSDDVVRQMSQYVLNIKKLACNYNIPIILASQLKRGDGKRDLSALKGTGALEELTDVVAFGSVTSDKYTYPKKFILDIMKSKYSETGIIEFDFFASNCDFVEART